MRRDPDTRKAFTVSLVLHGLVLGAIVLSFTWNWLFAEPMPDHVFQLSEPVPEAPAQPAQAAPRAQAPTPLKTPNIPDLKDPPPPPPKPTPAPPKPTPKPEPQTIDYRNFIKQNDLPKQAARPKEQPRQPPPTVKIDASAITRDLQQNLSREDTARINRMSSAQQSELYSYFQRLKALLDAAFVRPTGLRESLKVTVEFRVEGDGTISSTRIARSSGSTLLDQAALEAFRSVGRFPAPPGGAGYTRTVDFTMGE